MTKTLFSKSFTDCLFFQSRLRGSRGPSREPSFEEDRESTRSSVKSRSTTYISGGSVKNSSSNSNTNNTVKIEIKDAKKSVPPSPAIKKKVSQNFIFYNFCESYFLPGATSGIQHPGQKVSVCSKAQRRLESLQKLREEFCRRQNRETRGDLLKDSGKETKSLRHDEGPGERNRRS